jgi:AraC-like DNA-binding protein
VFALKDNIAGPPDRGLLHPARHLDVSCDTRGGSMEIHRSIEGAAQKPFVRRDKMSRLLVEEAEQLTLSDTNEPIHISALCIALAVSERTLRKAFHTIHGLPPCRRLRRLRLSGARTALQDADGQLTTVTEIAIQFGFVELGRFSVEYRKLFGESPSRTLSRSSPVTRAKSALIKQNSLGEHVQEATTQEATTDHPLGSFCRAPIYMDEIAN